MKHQILLALYLLSEVTSIQDLLFTDIFDLEHFTRNHHRYRSWIDINEYINGIQSENVTLPEPLHHHIGPLRTTCMNHRTLAMV